MFLGCSFRSSPTRLRFRLIVVSLCLLVGTFGIPGNFLPGLQTPEAQAVPSTVTVTCLIGASHGSIPPGIYPRSGPMKFMISCESSWPDGGVRNLTKVLVTYSYDGWLGYTTKDFRPAFRDDVDAGGTLAAEINTSFKYTAVGAHLLGVSCDVAFFGAGHHPCFAISVGDPGTTGWCDLYEKVHGVKAPECPSDPVNPINGSYSTHATDAAFPSSGESLSLRRSYDSTDKTTSMFGPGWTSNLDVRLYAGDQIGSHLPDNLRVLAHVKTGLSQVIITDGPLPSPSDPSVLNLARTPPIEDELSPAQSIPQGEVVLRAEGGGRYAFEPNVDGTYRAPTGVTDTLVRTSEGFELTRADQSTYRFDDKGHLLALVDRNDRGITLSWSTGHITRAQDVAGHFIDFTYENKRLVRADLSDGRSVSYGYDPQGNLTSVRDVRGFTTSYDYTP